MTAKESANSLNEINVKLCAAVKKHKCLYDQKSLSSTSPECVEGWKLVASECNVTVDFCKKRWQTLRKCFFEGLRSPENKYYFHDHLKFLHGGFQGKPSLVETLVEETKSSVRESLAKRPQVKESFSLQQSEVKSMHTSGNNDAASVSSWISADESDEIIEPRKQSESGINRTKEEDVFEGNKERLKLKRSVKRPLEPEEDDESIQDEPEEKHFRKSNKHSDKSQLPYKSIKVRLKKLKINAIEHEEEKINMIDCCSQTEVKRTKDVGTQYKFYSSDLDDTFIEVIKTNLAKMNARQKMNFKRKIYQSMLEVFDDATDFPNSNETAPLLTKQATFVDDTTTGELRLIHELVSLIHAAKSTPEIVNATDKPKTCVPVNNKSPIKMPLPIIDNSTEKQTSPISLSPSADDDDLQFFIDNLDDEDDVSLPLSWDELKTKATEPAKELKEDKSNGLPRYMVRKVFKASSGSGSKVIDKNRIYRVFPKAIHPNGNHAALNKNEKSYGSPLASSSNNLPIIKKKYGIGTFYIAKPQSKVTTSVSKITAQSLNNKPTNQTSNTRSISSQNASSSRANNNVINSQTVFKNVHPENRILCPTTGCFQTINTKNSGAPTYIQKASIALSTGLPTASKVMTTKLPITPKFSQRTSGSMSEEELNTRCIAKVIKPNPKPDSSATQMHISEPRSLNSTAIHDQTRSSRNFSPSVTSNTTATSTTSADEDTKSPLKTVISTTTSRESERMPILETAGTVEADNLNPLFMKPVNVKTEPVDK